MDVAYERGKRVREGVAGAVNAIGGTARDVASGDALSRGLENVFSPFASFARGLGGVAPRGAVPPVMLPAADAVTPPARPQNEVRTPRTQGGLPPGPSGPRINYGDSAMPLGYALPSGVQVLQGGSNAGQAPTAAADVVAGLARSPIMEQAARAEAAQARERKTRREQAATSALQYSMSASPYDTVGTLIAKRAAGSAARRELETLAGLEANEAKVAGAGNVARIGAGADITRANIAANASRDVAGTNLAGTIFTADANAQSAQLKAMLGLPKFMSDRAEAALAAKIASGTATDAEKDQYSLIKKGELPGPRVTGLPSAMPGEPNMVITQGQNVQAVNAARFAQQQQLAQLPVGEVMTTPSGQMIRKEQDGRIAVVNAQGKVLGYAK